MAYPYVPNAPWENLPSTNTPLEAVRLNNLEQGVKSASDELALRAPTDHNQPLTTLRTASNAALVATIISFLQAGDAAAARAAIGAGTPGGGGAGATGPITVASFYATQEVKDACDFACAAANDNQVEINAALILASRNAYATFTGDGFGGEGRIGVELVGPGFNIGNTQASGGAIKMPANTSLRGQGIGTLVYPRGTDAARGVIELLTFNALTDSARVTVRDLTICAMGDAGAPSAFVGHGIYFNQSAFQVFDMHTGGDGNILIENVHVLRAGGRGFYVTGQGRKAKLSNCFASRCAQEGFYIDIPDATLSNCTSTGGTAFARFRGTINSDDIRLSGCKALTSGNDAAPVATTGADGFLVEGPRATLVGCQAQDCGGYGFNCTSVDQVVDGCQADSCSTGFRINANGSFSGIQATYRGGAAAPSGAFPQNVGIQIVSSPKISLFGRTKVPNTGTAHTTGSFATNSCYRVVREGAGATALAETVLSLG